MKTETSNSFGSVGSCTPGLSYDFRVEAINDYGSSVPSVPITLKCGYLPTAPQSITILWDSDLDQVDLFWSGFAANGYDMTLFEVEFYSEISRQYRYLYCGESSSVANRACTVSLSTLTNQFGDY